MRLLPPPKTSGPVLVISVDLPASAGAADVAGRVASLFRPHRLPVTWGVADFRSDGAARRILTDSEQHEIALRGDSSWLGEGRATLSHHLVQQTMEASRAGVTVSTLVCHDICPRQHLDLLVKYGISMIAGNQLDSPVAASIQTMRFGLWQVVPTLRLPARPSVLSGVAGVLRARHAIDRAIASESLCHLALEGPTLVESTSAQRILQGVLRHVERRRQQKRLSVCTGCELAVRLAAPRTVGSATSILRKRPGGRAAA